jgi:hypothetical protein
MSIKERKDSDRKCKIVFCNGPEKCAVIQMIKDAPNIDDLNNTFSVIAPNCCQADNPDLIKLYFEKSKELRSTE